MDLARGIIVSGLSRPGRATSPEVNGSGTARDALGLKLRQEGADNSIHLPSLVEHEVPEGARAVRLRCGLFVFVDEADHAVVSALPWGLLRTGRLNYARHWRLGLMHRFLMGATSDAHVDHVNGNGLDNRRVNLRLCSPSQNHQNRRKTGGNTYKGVQALPSGSYRARIFAKGELIHLGTFRSATEAALAYDSAAKRLFGEFACVNFQDGFVSHAPTMAGEENEVTEPRAP